MKYKYSSLAVDEMCEVELNACVKYQYLSLVLKYLSKCTFYHRGRGAAVTCSQSFGAFPPQLSGRGSSVRVLLESGSENFGCEVVAGGRDLPQRRRLVDDLTRTQRNTSV